MLTDPIADLLTRVRNGQRAEKVSVSMPSSKPKVAICKVLKEEGYIDNYTTTEVGQKTELAIELKYFHGRPVIDQIKRVSKPGLRVYKSNGELPVVLGGLGIAVVSTSQGVMSDRSARKIGQGGEIICLVS